MEIKEFIKLEDEIKQILIDDQDARNDDMYLYWLYCLKKFKANNEPMLGLCFEQIFSVGAYKEKFNIRSFETVSRCRRKIQAECQELASDRTIEKLRKEQEKDFKEYARL